MYYVKWINLGFFVSFFSSALCALCALPPISSSPSCWYRNAIRIDTCFGYFPIILVLESGAHRAIKIRTLGTRDDRKRYTFLVIRCVCYRFIAGAGKRQNPFLSGHENWCTGIEVEKGPFSKYVNANAFNIFYLSLSLPHSLSRSRSLCRIFMISQVETGGEEPAVARLLLCLFWKLLSLWLYCLMPHSSVVDSLCQQQTSTGTGQAAANNKIIIEERRKCCERAFRVCVCMRLCCRKSIKWFHIQIDGIIEFIWFVALLRWRRRRCRWTHAITSIISNSEAEYTFANCKWSFRFNGIHRCPSNCSSE